MIKLFIAYHFEYLCLFIFVILGDLESYVQAKLKVNADYKDKLAFAKKCWLNIANAGKFSSDRTIKDYAENIWKIEPVKL